MTAQGAQAIQAARGLAMVPLHPRIGVEICGVDLRDPLDPATFAAILDAWHRHCIILFRGQRISEDDQVRFGEQFGTLAKVLNKHDGHSRNHPSIMFISNIRENGKLIGALPDGEMMFHSDQCYVERPANASMLYAMEIPARGGDTLFANMYAAYDALPESLRTKLQGMTALNVYDYANAATIRGAASEDAPRCVHPVFRTHPATGRKALYVNRLMTQRILELDPGESERTLAFLFDHAERGDWIYTHHWQLGDLLMWDNRCSMHARTDFDASERRLMRRCTVIGEKPF